MKQLLLLSFLISQSVSAQKQYVGVEVAPFYPFLSTKPINHKFWHLEPDFGLKVDEQQFKKVVYPGISVNAIYGIRIKQTKKLSVYFQTEIGFRYFKYNLSYTGSYRDSSNNILPFEMSIKKNVYDLCLGQHIIIKVKKVVIDNGLIPMITLSNGKNFSYRINNVEVINNATNPTYYNAVGLGRSHAFRMAYTLGIGYDVSFKNFEFVPSLKATFSMGDGEDFTFGQAPRRLVIPLNTLGISLKMLYGR